MKKVLKLKRRSVFFLLLILIHFLPARRVFSQPDNTKEFLLLLNNAIQTSSDRNWSEAVALWEKVVAENPVNGEYWGRMGDAYYNNTQYEKAIPAWKKQLELGSGRKRLSAYNIACCYALLGQKKEALDWLQKAFDLGFTNFRHAQTDADLKSLHNEERFKDIVALKDVSRMSRTEGWRYDLQQLKREVERKSFRGSPELSMAEFNKGLQQISSRIPQMQDHEIIVELMKLMKTVGDGHSGIALPIDRPDFKSTLPLQFYHFEEGFYIISADPKYKDLLGSQVLQFDNKTSEEVATSIAPLIVRDNIIGVTQRIPYFMRYPILLKTLKLINKTEHVNLRIKDLKGNTKTVAIIADTSQPNIWNILPNPKSWINFPQTLPQPVPLYLKDMSSFYWFDELKESKIVYCQINRVRNDPKESLEAFVQRMFSYIKNNQSRKLVIDLRWNNGGNTFLVPPLINAIIRNDSINTRGNLFVIIGRRTFSAAQNMATMLERHTNAIFIGEPSGSNPNFVGEEDFITLPYSKVPLNVSDLYWQSSWPTDQRTWIAPMIYTPPTFKKFRVNQDPAMEAILNYSSQPNLRAF